MSIQGPSWRAREDPQRAFRHCRLNMTIMHEVQNVRWF
jgi:hypothetical protein